MSSFSYTTNWLVVLASLSQILQQWDWVKKQQQKYVLVSISTTWNPPHLYNSNFYLIRAHPGRTEISNFEILAANFSLAGPYLAGDQISRDRPA